MKILTSEPELREKKKVKVNIRSPSSQIKEAQGKLAAYGNKVALTKSSLEPVDILNHMVGSNHKDLINTLSQGNSVRRTRFI